MIAVDQMPVLVALAAAAALPDRWIAVGVGPAERVIEPDSRGTFAGYGADVAVSLSPRPDTDLAALPLCAVFAGWLRGQVRPQARLQVRVFPADCPADAAVAHGRALRAEIDAALQRPGVQRLLGLIRLRNTHPAFGGRFVLLDSGPGEAAGPGPGPVPPGPRRLRRLMTRSSPHQSDRIVLLYLSLKHH
jgi:hypothetical protein